METCKQCQLSFEVIGREKNLCDRLNVPAPDLCPQCRMQSLMAFRNEWKLYRRKCDFTGDEIISAYPPDSPFKVYKSTVWWGNGWDAMEYGRDYDFKRPFFEQFADLQKAVPREGTSVFSSENSDYNSHIRQSKNCYMNSLVHQCEDMHYSYWMVHDKDVMDSMYTNESEKCYNCSSVNGGYDCVQLEESNNCSECYFSYQLRGCNHCIYSTNLVNKSYYAFNKPCTKDEFEAIKKKTLNGSWARWNEAYVSYLDMRKKAVHRYVRNLNCENVTGDHMYNSRNCDNCYEGHNAEECANSISLGDAVSAHSCYSAGWPACLGPVYMSLVTRAGQDIAYCNYTWFSNKLRYCDGLNACQDCFGCIGLQHKKYCILNKQYSKAEYDELMPKIIEHMKSTGEWGRFFPHDLSPCAYNESAAQDFFPLDKKTALQLGWRWREKDRKEYQPASITKIPDDIKEVDDSIINEILACEDCGKNYKIIQQELRFYRTMDLPIPRKCSDCRYRVRFDLRNPLMLFDRACDSCKKAIKSSYSPNRPEKVLCEECFLKAVD